jgi:TolA-binding protein
VKSPGSDHSRNSGVHVDEDLGLDLLHGLLSHEESERVLEHLAECSPCEKRFQEMVGERERLRALRALPEGARQDRPSRTGRLLKDRWEDFLGSMRRPRFQLAWIPVAAAAVLLFIVLKPDPGTEMLQQLPTSFEGTRFRASVAASSAEFEAGLEAYAARDFKRASQLLGKATTSGPLETVRRVYLGSALAWRGKHEEAAKVLEDVALPTLPDPWGVEARWTLYVSLRETGQEAKADSLLRVLAKEAGPVGDRARGLLTDDRAE